MRNGRRLEVWVSDALFEALLEEAERRHIPFASVVVQALEESFDPDYRPQAQRLKATDMLLKLLPASATYSEWMKRMELVKMPKSTFATALRALVQTGRVQKISGRYALNPAWAPYISNPSQEV